jgi:hypothetical protein
MRWDVQTPGWLAAVVVALVGCDPGGPDEPQGASVAWSMPDLDGVEVSGSLRFAVAWTYRRQEGFGLLTTSDGPLDRSATSFEVFVDLPPAERREQVAPTERLFLGYTNNRPMSTTAYRPRFVVYEDRDENGSFNADVLDHHGPDRVLALEEEPASIAYVIDVESVFSELPFSRIESFYVATDGRFSSFVTVVDSGNMLELSIWDPQVRLELDDPEFLRHSLACMRPTVSTTSGREVLLDEAVAPAMCGLDLADCRSVRLDEEPPPELPELDEVDPDFVAQCRRRGDLEALVVGRRVTNCDVCTCSRDYDETVWIADRSSLPEWWPCGDYLETCTDEDDDAFAAYSTACAQEQRERALPAADDE